MISYVKLIKRVVQRLQYCKWSSHLMLFRISLAQITIWKVVPEATIPDLHGWALQGHQARTPDELWGVFCETSQYASLHGDLFHVIGPLWGNPPVTSGFPSQIKTIMQRSDVLFVVGPCKCVNKQSNGLWLDWDVMAFIWRSLRLEKIDLFHKIFSPSGKQPELRKLAHES